MSLTPRQAKLRAVLDQRLGWVSCAVESLFHRHNTSAILRTCDVMGVHQVHQVQGHFSPSTGAAKGSERWLEILRHPSPEEAVRAIKDAGCALWVADLAEPSVPPEEVPLDRPVCLWLGAELVGVSPVAREAADGVVTIPMYGLAQSLNVSVSAALVLRPVCRRARALGQRALLSEARREEVWARWMQRERAARRGMEARSAEGG